MHSSYLDAESKPNPMKEPTRYLENAKKTLKESPVVDGRYADVKYVKSACGTAYLAVLKAIDDYLLTKGIVTLKKELPTSVDAYRQACKNICRGTMENFFHSSMTFMMSYTSRDITEVICIR